MYKKKTLFTGIFGHQLNKKDTSAICFSFIHSFMHFYESVTWDSKITEHRGPLSIVAIVL